MEETLSRAKITVTIDQELVEQLDKASRKRKASRSRLVEEAIRSWQRHQLEQDLVDGYRSMAKENAEVAEALLAAETETLE